MGGAAATAALAIKVTADARAAAASIDQSTQKVSKLGKAGQVAGRVLAAGLLVAAGAAVKFTQAAAEDAAAQEQLAQTAQKVAGATASQTSAMEDWIAAQGKAKGVADDELRPALSKLITVTKDVGQAQELAGLAMDISARTGKSLESVTQSLAKAQTGSVAGLAKYQVQTKDAAGKTRDLASVQKDLADLYGGASAAAADTAAGKQKILAVQMDELKESIGARLLPVMMTLTKVGLQVVEWITNNQTAALAIIGTLAGLLAIVKAVSMATAVWNAVTAVASVVRGVHAAVTGADTAALAGNTAAMTAHSAVTKTATAVQAVFNAVMAANPVVLVVLAVVALAAALVIAYKKSETFRAIVDAAFGAIAKAAGAAVDFIRDHWRLIITIIAGPIGLAVALVTKHWDKIKAGALAVLDWVRGNWPALKALITEPFTTARDIIGKVWDRVTGAFDAAKTTLDATATAVKNAVKGAFDDIASSIQAVIDKVQGFIDKLASLKNKGGGLLGKVPGLRTVAGAVTPRYGGDVVGTSGGAGRVSQVVINFNGTVLDPRGAADEIERMLRRRGVQLGVAVGAA